MNRWQRWAQRMRARHGRKLTAAAGALVLLRARLRAHTHLHSHQLHQLHMHRHLGDPAARRNGFAPTMLVRQAPAAAPLVHFSRVGWPIVRERMVHATAGRAGMLGTPWRMLAPPKARRTPSASEPSPVRSRRIAPLDPVRRVSIASAPAPRTATYGRDGIAPRLRRQGTRTEIQAGAMPVLQAKTQALAPQLQPSANKIAQLRNDLDAVRASQAAPAPAIDVPTLTGMVIEQIDRRMLAYRERMGRG